ncbi:MAG: alpha/beta-hydrolase family protein [Candidatus Nanopelagicales bacterium]
MRSRTRARLALAALTAAAGGYAAARPTLMPWPSRVRQGFIVAMTAASGTAAFLAAGSVGVRAGGLPTATQRLRRAGLVAAGSAAAFGAVKVAKGQATSRLEGGGRAIEPGFATPPAAETLSGGPGSFVDFTTVGREGARFLGSSVPPEIVQEVTGIAPERPDGSARPPLSGLTGVRVFVGYDSAPTPEERVALALAELRRTGAYDRSTLLIGAPAGSGYANPTPVDVLEILLGGDTATVAVGYGLLPSFLSLDRVSLAARTQSLLIEGIVADLASRAHRPRLLLYGESLGARVQQAAIPGGTRDLDRLGIDAALWVGTPGGPESVAFHAATSGESITIDRPEQIPSSLPEPRPRVWFLEHDGDPVVRFAPTVAYRRPDWLARQPRGRNVPEGMLWTPGITWAQVMIDTLFATNVKPGNFESRGHDYRADLGAVVPAAYGLSVDEGTAQRLEAALRHLEVERARRVGEA